jgi:hypothetical protein
MKVIGLMHTRAALAGVGAVAVSMTLAAAVSLPASAQTLVWSVVPSPSPSATGNWLSAASCVSATVCMAVGFKSTSSTQNDYATLAESWDGTGWSVVPSPSRGPRSNLNGVSCISAASCTAAGTNDTTGSAQSRTLIESGAASG